MRRLLIVFYIFVATGVIICASVDDNKREIDAMKANMSTLKTRLDAIFKKFTDLQTDKTYCTTIAGDSCGPCKCVDDYRQPEKYYCDCRGLSPMRDCREFSDTGFRYNGLYFVNMNSNRLTQVFCDQETGSGGWTIIQRRRDGVVNFNKNWQEYKEGFGDMRNEFWMGNDKIFRLIHQSQLDYGSELRVELYRPNTGSISKYYSDFEIGSELSGYKLHISGSDSMAYHNGMEFSAYDKGPKHGCAKSYYSAWWFNSCLKVNLNGLYFASGKSSANTQGIYWDIYGSQTSFTFTEMKVRRK